MLINELLIFGIASAGITFITVYGRIFNKIRPSKQSFKGMGHLFHCPMCFGFWVGAFLCGINDYTELFTFDHTVVNYFLCGAIGSAFSYAFAVLFGDNGLRIEHISSSNRPTEDESCCKPTQQIHNTYCGDKTQWEEWGQPKEISYEQPVDK